MSISPGERAPDFTLEDQNDHALSLRELYAKGPVVLFFYPKDFTGGCTTEVCAFRDAYEQFVKAGATVVGISSQGTESKKAFVARHHLPFSLLADVGGKVRARFGVKGSLWGLIDGRETYVIDRQGVVRHVFNSQIQAARHVNEALDVLSRLERVT